MGLINKARGSTSPWEYLKNWDQSDREPDFNNVRITAYMQNRWPGKYKIVHRDSPYGRFKYLDFEFDSPEAETFFRLKYPNV